MRRAAILLAGVMLAGVPAMITAQTEDEATAPSNPLGLGSDVKLLAPHDPSVRKATAIVNGAVITDTDVDQRLALVLASSGGRISDEEKARLRVQVLSNLIGNAVTHGAPDRPIEVRAAIGWVAVRSQLSCGVS